MTSTQWIIDKENLTSFMSNIDINNSLHIQSFNNKLLNIPVDHKEKVVNELYQYFEICHYGNLPKKFLGILHNIVTSLNNNYLTHLYYTDNKYEVKKYDYFRNAISNSRAMQTNDEYLVDYYENISQISQSSLDEFYEQNDVGIQLRDARNFNIAIYNNLVDNSPGLSDKEKVTMIELLNNNIRSGFVFSNNIDCLFNNTYGMFVALYHNANLNNNKRPKRDPNKDVENFNNKVLIPFKTLQSHFNDNLTKYYKLLFELKNNIPYFDANLPKYEELQKILLYPAIYSTSGLLETKIREFINKTLDVDPNIQRTYNGERISITEYYMSLIERELGKEFINEFNITSMDPRSDSNEFINKYAKKVNEFMNKMMTKGVNSENNINFENKTYEIIKNLAVNNNKIIDSFIESALDYLEDNNASIGFDNFIFNHMTYRCTCLLLMYYFMPPNVMNINHKIDNIIWHGDFFKPEDVQANIALSFDDSKPITNYGKYGINEYKNYMVFNEIFAMIALKIFPKLNSVHNNLFEENYDQGLKGKKMENVLYIIRPTQHDHTFCLARCNDDVFYSDDCTLRSEFLCLFNDVFGLDLSEDYNFVYQDFKNQLEFINKTLKIGSKSPLIKNIEPDLIKANKCRFIGYENGTNGWFVNYILSTHYKNVLRVKCDKEKYVVREITYIYANIDDFASTVTKQIYSSPQKMKGSGENKNIFITLAVVILVIVLIITFIVIFSKLRNSTQKNKNTKESEDGDNDSV